MHMLGARAGTYGHRATGWGLLLLLLERHRQCETARLVETYIAMQQCVQLRDGLPRCWLARRTETAVNCVTALTWAHVFKQH